MGRVIPEEVTDHRKLLFPFILVLVLLLGLGLATLYSASYYRALQTAGDPLYFVRRQALFVLLGIIGAFVVAGLPEKTFRYIVPAALFISLVLMVLTLTSPLGETRLGARRWLRAGPVSLQPSEMVKVAVILFLAHFLEKQGDRMQEFTITLVPVGVILLFAALILMQRDFSTALLFGLVTFMMVAVSDTKKLYLVYLGVITVIPGILVLLTEEYRMQRVIGFLFPELDPTGINYQVNMSLRAVAAGGVFGTGFGLGTMKLGALPEVSSDFIFASFAEEAGLMGVLIVWLLFAALGFIGYSSSLRHRRGNRRLFYIGFGCTSMILWQALINMAVAVGAVPATGLPLPFFSLGGTNLTMTLVMCGCIGRAVYAPAYRQSGYKALDSLDYVMYN